jgi:putative redox protein
MATTNPQRSVTVRRTEAGRFAATNTSGGDLTMGTGDDAAFSPIELLLAAIAGCTAIDVDVLTTRRAEPEAFDVRVEANKVRDEHGNHLTDIVVTFAVTFPPGDAGDAARAVLPEAVRQSHERLCTVSRTVELATPIAIRVQ